ncbi:DUF2180 family protein [Streptomyces sp. HNM0575]|nr:DUF2180 family protein [Streptomyces sp. HNM0575]
MHCYDCHSLEGTATPVLATCVHCGAGLCAAHANATPHSVHRVTGTGTALQPTAARRILCTTCHKAQSHQLS